MTFLRRGNRPLSRRVLPTVLWGLEPAYTEVLPVRTCACRIVGLRLRAFLYRELAGLGPHLRASTREKLLLVRIFHHRQVSTSEKLSVHISFMLP